jgi:hypothetical protein
VSTRTSSPLAVLIALLLFGATAASAAPSRAVSPSKATGRIAHFELPARTIERAEVRVSGKRLTVPGKRLARAQRAGRLKVRLPRGAAGRQARLVVVFARAKKKPRSATTTPAPPVTAPAPAPAAPVSSEPVSGAAASVACGLGSFAVGNWPGACWRPYSDASPWNQRIPAGAKVDGNSAGVVQRLMEYGTPQHLTAGEGEDWQHPTYYSQATDPVYTLHCLEDWGRCALEGLQIRIPAAAKPAQGGDGHMTVVDQATGWEYDMWQVQSKPAAGGTLTMSWGGKTRIDGDGLGSEATASRFGNLAGVIRAQELRAGRINHALFMVVECDNGGFVYPASKNGASCARSGRPTTDAPAMGQRFQLNLTDEQIQALNVPAWKKTILRAMAEYGMYVGDTGTGSWGLQFESGSTYESFGVQDPLETFAADNNVTNYKGTWVFNMRDGVDWAKHLRVVDSCVAQKTC